jgi:diacylglycerol kinase family enzyme
MRAGKTLGIVPTGTGNAVATELGIPPDPNQALLSLSVPGEVVEVDLGEVQGEPFVNVVTLGLTSMIARELRDQPKDVMGKWAYLPALIKAYQATRPIPVTVTAGDKVFDGRAIQVVVAVTRNHGGPFPTTPEAAHDDGLLSTYVVEAQGRAGLLLYASALMFGQHTALPSVWTAESPEVLVKPSIPRTFVVDGDRMSFPEVHAVAHHRAVRVFKPGTGSSATGE